MGSGVVVLYLPAMALPRVLRNSESESSREEARRTSE